MHKTALRTGTDLAWPDAWKFEVSALPNALQEGWLEVKLMDEVKAVGTVHIPLWSIVVGPCSQSFLMPVKGKPFSRFEADIRALQISELSLQPLQVRANLPASLHRFSLTMRFVGDKELACHSDIQEMPTWLFPVTTKMDFSLLITGTSFLQSALHFKIWKHESQTQRTLTAESWVGLAKLVRPESVPFPKHSSDLHPKQKPQSDYAFETALWYGGQKSGTLCGELRITGAPFLAQLPLGVNTEQGYKLQHTELLPRTREQVSWKPQLPPQLVQLDALSRELKDLLQRSDSPALAQAHVSHITLLSYELRETEREGQTVHVYSSEVEAQAAQLLFLDLGEFLLEHAEQTPAEAKGLYYECLVLLTKRGELDLGYLALERKEQQAIGQRYWKFLKRVLGRALSKLGEKDKELSVREFAECVCAQGYFRVREFREEVLSALRSNEAVSEWRGTTYDLEQDISQPWALLDWDKYFRRYLPEEQQSAGEIMLDGPWKRRLAKRGLAFFRFLCEWTRVVTRAFGPKSVPWHELPGYHVLVKSLLLAMKSQPSSSEGLQQAVLSFLRNARIVSIFVLVLFHKTNVHQAEAVSRSMELLCSWFTALHESGFSLPATFPSAFFAQGLVLALRSDLVLNQVSILWLLYRCYHVLDSEAKQEVVLDALLSQPAPLMYHWSKDVRSAFWSLALYRLLSLKWLSLLPLSEVDKQICAKAEEAVVKAQALQGGVTEPFTTTPYESQSREELKRALLEYESWLASHLSHSPDKSASFPFPDMGIQRPFEDTVERELADDW